jgi:hypothetical protein
MSVQVPLFVESLAEALRTAAHAIGGLKAAGVLLWPELSADRAGRDLADCLQAGATRKLSLEQIELLIRRAREQDCHAPMSYLASIADYAPPEPIDPESQIQKEKRELAEVLRGVMSRMDRLEKREHQQRSARR